MGSGDDAGTSRHRGDPGALPAADVVVGSPAGTTNGVPVAVAAALPATLEHAAEALRAMAYGHRLHLLLHLLRVGEQTPGALAAALELEPTLVAHHLRCLRDARLIRRQRRGRNVFYSLEGPATSQLIQEVIRFARQLG